jgi:hypothetical protein
MARTVPEVVPVREEYRAVMVVSPWFEAVKTP